MGSANKDLIPSRELQTELEHLGTIVLKPAGSFLFRRGDEASGVFLIRSGRISLALDYETPVYPARLLGPGAVTGLPATVSGNPYSLTAKVVEDSELGFVPRAQVVECLKNKPWLCFQVMDILSDEIADIRSAFKRERSRVRAVVTQ
ncbi:MAG TPA: cyclic nucleotide-binding domain-containing protein [Pyrinomonadaceae bacterium]|jgi:CRP-like cAMP-binding protein